jgi:NAD+ diphosphatase
VPGSDERSFASFLSGVEPPVGAPAGAPAGAVTPSFWFAFQNGKLLVAKGRDAIAVPVAVPIAADPLELGLHPQRTAFLGTASGRSCFAAEVPEADRAPEGWSFEGMRSLFSVVPEDLFRVAGRATQVLDWDSTHTFCGRCGAPTAVKPRERAKECPACGLVSYPRISPAVIVAVVRGDRILLARAHRFAPSMYSVLAGFVEPGETLEDCVHREVKEETGIEVRNVRYFTSQPWPFPNSLMVAFTAEYAAGEIALEPEELADAGWYAADALPLIPDRITVARKLIDWFVESRRG